MTIRVWLLAVVLWTLASVAWAQAPGPFATANVGISRTSIDGGGGASLPSATSSSGNTLGVGAGVRVTEQTGFAGELSFDRFATVQTQGGVGACCSVLNREHRLVMLSAVIKVNAVRWLALVGGIARARNAIDEQKIFTDHFSITGARPPITTNRDVVVARAALVVGIDTPVRLQNHFQIVPTVRLYRFRPTDDEYGRATWTTRVSIGVHFGS